MSSASNIMCLSVLTASLATSIFFIGNNDAAAALNVTRTLLLEVNATGIGPETEKEIVADGYTLTMYVKGNKYSDHVIIPLTNILNKDNVVEIPIVNNEEQEDDGSDFRVDVWVNNYDKRYKIVNYPIKFNSTFESVDITDMIEYVLEDTREEKADDADNFEADSSAEYSLIKDRPDNDKDDRPHAKIKDPKDNN